MAKKVEGYIKLQIAAGKATPAPPVATVANRPGVILPSCSAANIPTCVGCLRNSHKPPAMSPESN